MEDKNLKMAAFGAGCFWGVEEVFRTTEGVEDTQVGYMGGTTQNPTYEEVCDKDTGHAETVRMLFDPAKISYADLVRKFFNSHNPTTKNKQGPDVGSQYRSVIFYYDQMQKNIAEEMIKEVEQSGKWKDPIVTEIVEASEFYVAEDYHQRYWQKRGGGVCRV